jgi:hypothetical protein
LAAQLDFTIGPETIQWIKQDSALLARVPGERLRAEVFGILKEANSGRTLRGLRDTGLLFILFPAFTEMANVEQGGFHHTDVLTHSLETVDALEDLLGGSLGDPLDDVAREYLHPSRRLPILKLAALLHDAGKPETRADAGRPPVERPYSFHGHEKVSAVHAAVAAERLRLSARERKSLVRLVSLHMRPGWLYSVSEGDSKKLSGRALLRLARDAGGDLPGLALLAIADALSRKGPLSGPEGAVGVVEFAGRVLREMEERIVPVLKGPRWITGHDLIASLGVSEGPLVGRLLYAVEEAHAAGEIQTREQALSLAKRLAEAETQVH